MSIQIQTQLLVAKEQRKQDSELLKLSLLFTLFFNLVTVLSIAPAWANSSETRQQSTKADLAPICHALARIESHEN